jgi:hypothetical protein
LGVFVDAIGGNTLFFSQWTIKQSTDPFDFLAPVSSQSSFRVLLSKGNDGLTEERNPEKGRKESKPKWINKEEEDEKKKKK